MTQQELRRISQRLANPSSTAMDRAECYAALRNYSDSLKLRDLNRRAEVVTFSTGLQLRADIIADVVSRSSLADFCILHGLARAEVLERTGMAKAGIA